MSDEYWSIASEYKSELAPNYDPTQWAGKVPLRLYHNTRAENAATIIATSQFDPHWDSDRRAHAMHLTAMPGERFGDVTMVFDGMSMARLGFSPKTIAPDEGGICFEEKKNAEPYEYKGMTIEPDDPVYLTYAGYNNLLEQSSCGCIPEGLWNTYLYTHLPERCRLQQPDWLDKDPRGDIDIYVGNPTGPYGSRDKPNLGYQPTFLRVTREPIQITRDMITAVIVESEDAYNTVMEQITEVGMDINKVMKMSEAMDMFSELGKVEHPYNTNYQNVDDRVEPTEVKIGLRDKFPLFDRQTLFDV